MPNFKVLLLINKSSSEVVKLTSETPTLCCPEDTPVWSSASERCSGNEKRAAETNNRVTTPLYRAQAVYTASVYDHTHIADSPGHCALF